MACTWNNMGYGSLKWHQSIDHNTTYYQSANITIALSCIISEIKRNIDRISAIFSYPICLHAPIRGSRPDIAITFGTEKLEYWSTRWYKKFQNSLCLFVANLRSNTRIDRRTDHVDTHDSNSIGRAMHSVARSKKSTCLRECVRMCATSDVARNLQHGVRKLIAFFSAPISWYKHRQLPFFAVSSYGDCLHAYSCDLPKTLWFEKRRWTIRQLRQLLAITNLDRYWNPRPYRQWRIGKLQRRCSVVFSELQPSVWGVHSPNQSNPIFSIRLLKRWQNAPRTKGTIIMNDEMIKW